MFENDALLAGEFSGADFDESGTLYFYYWDYVSGDRVFGTLGAPSTWAAGDPTFISSAPANEDEMDVRTANLTVETNQGAALANTGAEFPALWLAAGGVAVLVGAVTLVTTRRRRSSPQI